MSIWSPILKGFHIKLIIPLEIDGATHNTEKVKKIDKRRDEFSNCNGWRVIRFSATEVKRDVSKCINELQNLINSSSGRSPMRQSEIWFSRKKPNPVEIN